LRPYLRVDADRLGSDSRLLAVPACGEGGPAQSLRYVRWQVDGLALFNGISSPVWRCHSSPLLQERPPRATWRRRLCGACGGWSLLHPRTDEPPIDEDP